MFLISSFSFMSNITTLPRQAVILAGGRGLRLRPLTDTRPKPMIRFDGKPFLEYLIEMVRDQGFQRILLLLGYLPNMIQEYFGDGSQWGIEVEYAVSALEDDTGRRIKLAERRIDPLFLLMYCDNYWPLDLERLMAFHNKNQTAATVTVYTNKDGITRNNMYVDENGYVVKYDKSRKHKKLNGVEIGFFILEKKVLDLMPDDNFSFEKVVLPQLIAERQLSGYLTDHRYYSIGSLERISKTERFLQPKKVIFLDRDGVINKKPPKAGYVKSWDEFEFLSGAIEAMKLLAQDDYEIFIISNQAGIARGAMTEHDLKEIHGNMEKELEKHNVKIEKIYYCPHGWDDRCECRKPKPGMLFQAAREYDLDLSKSTFIGDDERDLQAGNAARCRTILVDSEASLFRVVQEKIINE